SVAGVRAMEPDVYVALDVSGSMKGSKLRQAKNALGEVADELADDLRFGLMVFSGTGSQTRCSKRAREVLALGKHTSVEIKRSYRGVSAAGGTPTPEALKKIRKRRLFTVPGSKKTKTVVLVTDGQPNQCPQGAAAARRASVKEARRLNGQGVFVYSIGFQFGSQTDVLDKIAQAGGTRSSLTATDKSQLVRAILGIALTCEFEIDKPKRGLDPNEIWVKANDEWLSRTEYSYDADEQTVSLSREACRRLKPQEGSIEFEIVLGCPQECPGGQKSDETCNYRDDDCDGTVDEGFRDVTPEICDGESNDCDDKVDEGCPNCLKRDESCSSNGDCCGGNCTPDNKCRPHCRPVGATCTGDGDCCSGTCVAGGGGLGICRGK
ncbi:MAG: VWA domain-containing protein, partial [Bradymonadaceae bacterium]